MRFRPWYEGRTVQTFPVPCPFCAGQQPAPAAGALERIGHGVIEDTGAAVRIGYLSPADIHTTFGTWELLRCLPCERCGWEMDADDAEHLTDTLADELAQGIDRRE